MNIVFFGSDDFALAHLKELYHSKHNVVGCVTQPDRPKGRGMKVAVSPIKEFTNDQGFLCLQPNNVKAEEFISELKQLKADVFVVIAYGRILPQEILDIPVKEAVNVHGSLLPYYRGAAPINWAIINGETMSGLSVIVMNAKMDAGDILRQKKISINAEDTSITLREKMMEAGPQLLLEALNDLDEDKALPQEQNEKDVTTISKLTKELGLIDWSKDALTIHNLVRGLLPWPCAYTHFKGKQLKIMDTQVLGQEQVQAKPGEIVDITKDGMIVKTGHDLLLIKVVQPESSKWMTAHQFVIGQHLAKGFILG